MTIQIKTHAHSGESRRTGDLGSDSGALYGSSFITSASGTVALHDTVVGGNLWCHDAAQIEGNSVIPSLMFALFVWPGYINALPAGIRQTTLPEATTDPRNARWQVNVKLHHLCTGVALAGSLLNLSAADADLIPTGTQRYDVAVAKAVDYLTALPPDKIQYKTLVTYALLKAGVDKSSPRLVEGIRLAKRRAAAAEYDQYQESYEAAVDAMLLVDALGTDAQSELQKIADMISGYQRNDGAWFDPRDGPQAAGDVSLTQYCILGLWAAQRGGCEVKPSVFDRAAQFLVSKSNYDGGWSYRPGTDKGYDDGKSSHTMTMATIGSLGVCRFLLFGVVRSGTSSLSPESGGLAELGILETRENEPPIGTGAFSGYQPKVTLRQLNRRIQGGVRWNRNRFRVKPPTIHMTYFYYALERAAAFEGIRDDWYTTYGDALLEEQEPLGSFASPHPQYGPDVDTSLAVLFYMRSTRQILKYGPGSTVSDRGLWERFFGTRKKTRKLSDLDWLIEQMQNQSLEDINVSTDELVEKIQFSSREELIGKADELKILVRSKDPYNRKVAYWALSRTADFDLIPLMLDGLHDPVFDVSKQALTGLRYISRRPHGFNLALNPLAQLPDDADEAAKLNTVKVWKDKASKVWREWYSRVRPYEARDGLDEIGLPVVGAGR